MSYYSKGVIYRDISANNILISEKRNLLLKGEASFASDYTLKLNACYLSKLRP